MTVLRFVFPCSLVIALAACGQSSEGDTSSADDFAARINGDAQGETVTITTPTPPVAQPLPVPAQGSIVPGTINDPNSSTCGANLMSAFIGQDANDQNRLAILKAAGNTGGEVRFVLPGTANVNPDPTNPRLNIMIDNLGVIRDARCG